MPNPTDSEKTLAEMLEERKYLEMGISLALQLNRQMGTDNTVVILCSALCFLSEVKQDKQILRYAQDWLDSYAADNVENPMVNGSLTVELANIMRKKRGDSRG